MSRDTCNPCGTLHEVDDLWQITRRPNGPEEFTEIRAFGGRVLATLPTSGPQHLRVCPDCMHKAMGFLAALKDVRKERS